MGSKLPVEALGDCREAKSVSRTIERWAQWHGLVEVQLDSNDGAEYGLLAGRHGWL